jgi:peptidoglycan/LPS O-acetylase OafA/YrhL
MLARPILNQFNAAPLSASLEPDRNSFGVVRLLLAFMVLVSHAFYLKTGTVMAEPLRDWTGYTLGQHAVQGFFILSGLLVAQSLARSGSVWDFGIARGLRIFPGLIACVILTACVLGPLASGLSLAAYFGDSSFMKYLAKTTFLVTGSAPLPGVFTTNPAAGAVNTSLWTLKYEVLCYAGLAAIGALAFWSRRRTEVFCAAAAIWALVMMIDRPSLDVGAGAIDTVQYFALFFGAGVFAYILRHRLLVTAVAMVPLIIVASLARKTGLAEFTYAALLTYAICWIGSLSFGQLTSFTRAQDYSFGLYIYAMPISQAILQVHPGIGVWGLIFTTTCLTVPLACLSWNLIEHPAIAWSKRLRQSASAKTYNGQAMDPAHNQTTRLNDLAPTLPTMAVASGAEASQTMRETWSMVAGEASRALVEVEAAKTRLYAAMVRTAPTLHGRQATPVSIPEMPTAPAVTAHRLAQATRARHHAMA